MKIKYRTLLLAAAGTGVIASVVSTVYAQQNTAQIDRDLAGQLDFRDSAYSVCLDQTTCTVGDVTVSAFRAGADGAERPANIYWDPIDGLGVLDGGQNDEIDFDETLVVKLNRPASVSAVWLSDLFQHEAGNYGGQAITEGDGEVARIDLRSGGASRNQVIVNSEVDLPPQMFNAVVDPSIFHMDGDLLERVVINNDKISLVGADGTRNVGTLSGSGGLIDADKQELFAGLPTVEIDTQRLLALIDGVVLFPAGDDNANLVAGLVRQGETFETVTQRSTALRATSDLSNGEVAAYLGSPVFADEVVFSAPFSTSNDFSVSGLVVLK